MWHRRLKVGPLTISERITLHLETNEKLRLFVDVTYSDVPKSLSRSQTAPQASVAPVSSTSTYTYKCTSFMEWSVAIPIGYLGARSEVFEWRISSFS